MADALLICRSMCAGSTVFATPPQGLARHQIPVARSLISSRNFPPPSNHQQQQAFLADALLDRAVFPLGRVEALPDLGTAAADATDSAAAGAGADGGAEDANEPLHMVINGAAMENLEVLEAQEGGGTAGAFSAFFVV